MIVTADAAGIAAAAEYLRGGGLVIHPTETCYGIACDLRSIDAVRALFAFKRRPGDKPVSGLFASVEAAKHAVVWQEQATQLASTYLPGPLTIVLPLQPNSGLFPGPDGGATLGVRISSHPVAQALAEACGFPISTTSANLHGQPNPYSIADLQTQFGPALDQVLVLDGGILPGAPPSTVIDLVGGAVLRGGTVTIDPHALPSL